MTTTTTSSASPATPTKRPRKPRTTAGKASTHADLSCAVLEADRSIRQTMPAHERAVIDAALAILAKHIRQPNAALASPKEVRDYLRLQIGAERREHLAIVFLDAQHAPIAFEVIHVGTLTQTSVYPREVVIAALAHHASAVILCHNHPSQSAEPSRADDHLTKTLKTALALVDVRLLDHFVVTATHATSMAERGLI